jgi:ParB-like chromosome segregation protein Spo0J
MRAAIQSGDAKFKPELSEGPITFWRDPADGKTYVVDGHHRLEIARRTGTEQIEARELNAPNVQTARAFGAYRNIASGHASPIDVAKFMRDTGIGPDHLAQQGISLGSKLVTEGSRLANLDDSIFDQVVTGKLPERTGIAIAQIADKTAQRGMLELLKRKQANGAGFSYAEIEALARRATLAGTTEATGGLFGPTSESNAVEAARVEAYVRNRLSSDKRLFGFVSKGERPAELSRGGNVINVKESQGIAEKATQVLAAFDRLISYKGPVNDAINEAAGAVKSGKSQQAARENAYRRVHEAVAEELKGAQ